jgi:glycosyltransferase involved in cell wall biosynthesis
VSIENSPGVSVIIPAYNYAQFLERAVRSAFAQRHRPIEVIVIDDGSTDHTPALCADLQAEFPSLRYIRQANAGLSAARNTGIRNAIHPFVAFLDADDEWLPDMLAVIMADFSTLPPSTPAAACNCYRVDASGAPIGEKITAPRGDRFFTAADILLKTRFMPSCAVARRSCFLSAGLFDTTLRSSEDRDMWIRLASQGPIRYLDRLLVRIRRHDRNMSRNTDRMRGAMGRVRQKAFRARVMPHGRAGFWLRVLAIDHFQGAWMYWDEGRPLRLARPLAGSPRSPGPPRASVLPPPGRRPFPPSVSLPRTLLPKPLVFRTHPRLRRFPKYSGRTKSASTQWI